MHRHLIRADNAENFALAKSMVAGGGRVLVESERRLYLSVADLPEPLLHSLRAAGLRVTEERPSFSIGQPGSDALTSGPRVG